MEQLKPYQITLTPDEWDTLTQVAKAREDAERAVQVATLAWKAALNDLQTQHASQDDSEFVLDLNARAAYCVSHQVLKDLKMIPED